MNNNLVKDAQKGNINAFEQLILNYKNDLYKIARTTYYLIEYTSTLLFFHL